MWGNKACDGYSNQDETEQFCSQEDVKDYFCDRFQGESYPLKWSRRIEKINDTEKYLIVIFESLDIKNELISQDLIL